jgi:inorganic pyrophosphatase
MVDGGDADDKIVAVLDGDVVWGAVSDVSELPVVMMERLHHYFTTYKLVPDVEPRVSIRRVYGRELALQVIRAAVGDYDEAFGRYSRDDARSTDSHSS